ncbi:response regulator [Novosphingobium panipatense]|uniref:Response regulator receiver domain-containing protein n=1 Tax=Novosphingobium panipatense TaxID=428991 RepID=A0ABY1QQX7_9SPHN|nr:response regulator [Novosphingobium panipatense]SMP75358.1 Response regulator receiver domain-containing protein [Novosphingobium panipatense]
MPNEVPDFEGMRVLVAEDEFLVSMLLEEMLADLGCEVVGPYATLSAALEGATAGNYDVAVIDLNLAGEKAHPVIAELAERNVPVAIASGGFEQGLEHQPAARLDKPYSSAQLEEAMKRLQTALQER